MKMLVLEFILTALVLLFSSTVSFAHPGNTASDGCHYCRTNCSSWGVPWNTRHCHGGSTYTPPAPTCNKPTSVTGITFDTKSENSACDRYTVNLSWDTKYNSSGYSIKLSPTHYDDPGPLSDTKSSNHTYYDVAPGKYYFHIRAINSCGSGELMHYSLEVLRDSVKVTVSTEDSDSTTKVKYSSVCADYVEVVNNDGAQRLKTTSGTINLTKHEEKEDFIIQAVQGTKKATKGVVVPAVIIEKEEKVVLGTEADVKEVVTTGLSDQELDDSDLGILFSCLFFPSLIVFAIFYYLAKSKVEELRGGTGV